MIDINTQPGKTIFIALVIGGGIALSVLDTIYFDRWRINLLFWYRKRFTPDCRCPYEHRSRCPLHHDGWEKEWDEYQESVKSKEKTVNGGFVPVDVALTMNGENVPEVGIAMYLVAPMGDFRP